MHGARDHVDTFDHAVHESRVSASDASTLFDFLESVDGEKAMKLQNVLQESQNKIFGPKS